MKLKLLKKLSRVSRISSRFSRFSKVLTAFVYFSSLSSISYFATTENQVLHVYKDWTGLISGDVLSSADVLSDDNIISSEPVSDDISEDIADMAVSNDTPASSDNSNDSNDSFDNFVSNDTNDTEGDTEADTEGEAEEQSDTEGQGNSGESSGNTGNTLAPVPPVASGPDTPSEATPDSESIAILTTRLTADHHLIATLSISGVMGADVAVFPALVTGHGQHNNDNAASDNATAPDSAGGNIYTVANTVGSSAGSYPAVASDDIDNVNNADKNVDKPDSLLLNFENEEGVVESVRLWLDNEIDETVILDGITASNDTSNTISTDMADFSSRVYDGNISQPDLPRLAVPLSDLSDLSNSSSSDLAAISDTVIPNASGDVSNVNTGYTLDWFIGLDQLASPIIVILPSTNEQYYFPNGTALANYANFAQEYRVAEVRATTRAEIEVRLEKKVRK